MDNPEQEPIENEASVEERLEKALISKEKAEAEPDSEEQPDEADEESEESTDEAEVVEELYEVEYEGKKAQVPKELKDAFLRQSDYSQKTASLADERRYLAEQKQVLQLQQQIESAVLEQRVELQSLVATSKQYDNAIQQAISQGDGNTVAILTGQQRLLQNQIEEKAHGLRGKMNEQHELLQYDKQQRQNKADEEAGKRIPNFSEETKKSMVQAAKKLGFHEAEIRDVDDPRVYEALWKAAQWDELQTKSASVKTKVKDAPKTLPAKGQPAQTATVKTQDKLRAQLRKTGRPEAATTLIESLLTKGRR